MTLSQIGLYTTSFSSKGKDATIKDFKLEILIYFNSPIAKHWTPLHQTLPIFLLLSWNWTIFATLEALGEGLQLFFKLHNKETTCEDLTSFHFLSVCSLSYSSNLKPDPKLAHIFYSCLQLVWPMPRGTYWNVIL